MITKSPIDLFMEISDSVGIGYLDNQLTQLKKIIEERIALTRGNVKLEDFSVGNKVVINEKCGTIYLRGETGTVTGIRRSKIAITFDNPKGRFSRKTSSGEVFSAEVIVPISLVDKIV